MNVTRNKRRLLAARRYAQRYSTGRGFLHIEDCGIFPIWTPVHLWSDSPAAFRILNRLSHHRINVALATGRRHRRPTRAESWMEQEWSWSDPEGTWDYPFIS